MLAIDRVPLTPRRSPDVALVCAAGAEVLLSFRPGAAGALAALRLDARRSKGSSKDAKSKKSKGAASKAPKAARVRHVRVKPLSDDADCRYRDGVAAATSAGRDLATAERERRSAASDAQREASRKAFLKQTAAKLRAAQAAQRKGGNGEPARTTDAAP